VLADPGFWAELMATCSIRLAHRRARLRTYGELVGSGEMLAMVADYAAGRLALAPPTRRSINRSGGRRKVLFIFAPRDELFLRALNRVLQPRAADLHSRLCHSFQPGRGVRTAYNQVLGTPDLDSLACVRLDVRDYFNSISPAGALEALPGELRGDRPLVAFLERTLLDRRVVSDGVEVVDDHKGVMAGTPIAPLLSNLYLRGLDAEFEAAGAGYLRYADDFLILGPPAAAEGHLRTVEARLAALGLGLNPRKTQLVPPGEAWEFLGLRYHQGALDLAGNTVSKMRHRVRRLARKARTREAPASFFMRAWSRRVYGVGGDPADFTWATWFFPLLSGDTTLRHLDGLVQEQARFAVTGRHERRNLGRVPYADLRAAGYLPMVSAYHAFQRSPGAYGGMIAAVEARLG
jgi:hypothetical protein